MKIPELVELLPFPSVESCPPELREPIARLALFAQGQTTVLRILAEEIPRMDERMKRGEVDWVRTRLDEMTHNLRPIVEEFGNPDRVPRFRCH